MAILPLGAKNCISKVSKMVRSVSISKSKPEGKSFYSFEFDDDDTEHRDDHKDDLCLNKLS